MKKSNILTFLLFVLILGGAGIWMGARKASAIPPKTIAQAETMETVPYTEPETVLPAEMQPAEETVPEEETATVPQTEQETEPSAAPAPNAAPEPSSVVIPQVPAEVMQNSLFIGDSRTVGLWEYAPFEGADYFADVGMTVYNIDTMRRSVPSVGKVTLEELLNSRHYDKIYLMLGINEAGYQVDQTARYYGKLVGRIHELQPDAALYLQANLHVSKKRSDQDSMINNPVINEINQRVSQIAQEFHGNYLDVNSIFDDSTGSLTAELTGDDTHLYGKHYDRWAKWIAWQTELCGQGKAGTAEK